MVYRRTDREMSCYEHEYDFAARKDRVSLSHPAGTRGVGRQSPIGLECLRVELGAPDASGRPAPTAVQGSEFVSPRIRCQSHWSSEAFARGAAGPGTKKGLIAVDASFQTNIEGVYAIGDCIRASGAASTVMAVQDGKLAAAAIHQQFAQRAEPVEVN